MHRLVDDVLLVSDAHIVAAKRLARRVAAGAGQRVAACRAAATSQNRRSGST